MAASAMQPVAAVAAGGARPQRQGGAVDRGRTRRLAVCLAGALAACAAVASLAPRGGGGSSELLAAAGPTRRDMVAALRGQRRAPQPAGEGAMIKEQASEDTNRRERVAMQAETLRSALRAMGTESPPGARAQLARAEAALRKGAEGGSTAGLAALQGARAVLTQVLGEEAAADKASAAGPARTQSLTSAELSVPDERRAWRERYMERYAECWPHCAPEANIMNTIDSSKYPYNEEAGGHRWTSWRIGHSGINAAYAQAERKYYNEGRRVREAANADRVYPNTLGPAYKASPGAASTSLLGHSPTSRRESRAAYDREVDREWRHREREAHPYRPLEEGERGARGGSRYGDERRAEAPQGEERREESWRAERPRRQAMQQTGSSEEPAPYQWTGRGGQEETNVWSTNYLRRTSNQYYGSQSGHTWAWRDDSAQPDGYYYNVLSAPAAQAAAEQIVNGGPAPSPEEASADAAAIVNGGDASAPSPAADADAGADAGADVGADATTPAADATTPAAAPAAQAASGDAAGNSQQSTARAAFHAVHQLAAKKVAQKSFQWHPVQQLHKATQAKQASQQGLAVAHSTSAHARTKATKAALSKIGINAGGGLGSYGDVRVKAPGGGIAVGQIFRAAGPKRTQQLAMTPMSSYPYVPAPAPRNFYASAAVGAETPVNTSPDLPPVTFVSAPYGGSASVTLPVYKRTPQNPWVEPPRKMTAVERAKLSAAAAAKAASVAQAASAGVASATQAPAAEGAGDAAATAAAGGEAGGAPSTEAGAAGAAGAEAGGEATAAGEASTDAARKAVGGLAKAGLAMQRRGASSALSLGERARQVPQSMNSIIAKPVLAGGGSAQARDTSSLRAGSALEAWRRQRQMMVAGFMAEQEASRMTDRPPQPVVGLGTDSFVLSIPGTAANTELATPQSPPAMSSKVGAPSLEEKGSQGL
jgi:hypothetical protein